MTVKPVAVRGRTTLYASDDLSECFIVDQKTGRQWPAKFHSAMARGYWKPIPEREAKHMGPGPHPSGSPQLVHAKPDADFDLLALINGEGIDFTSRPSPLPFTPSRWAVHPVRVDVIEKWNQAVPEDVWTPEDRDLLRTMFQEADVTINVSRGVMEDMLASDGKYRSQHETGFSGGAYNPYRRLQIEREMFGWTDEPEDERLGPDEYVIYGSVAQPGRRQIREDVASRMYGKYALVLNKDVRARTTVSIDDSLNNYRFKDNHRLGVAPLEDVGEHGWAEAFLDQRVNSLNSTGSVGRLRTKAGSPYIEAQIHGGVSTDDIDFVQMPDVKPFLFSEPPGAQEQVEQWIKSGGEMSALEAFVPAPYLQTIWDMRSMVELLDDAGIEWRF